MERVLRLVVVLAIVLQTLSGPPPAEAGTEEPAAPPSIILNLQRVLEDVGSFVRALLSGAGSQHTEQIAPSDSMTRAAGPALVPGGGDGPSTEMGGAYTASEYRTSAIQTLTGDSQYFLKVDLQDTRVRFRVGLANNDTGGLQTLDSMKNRYSGQGFAEWAIINGDYFNSGCTSGNCGEGLTYIDGSQSLAPMSQRGQFGATSDSTRLGACR